MATAITESHLQAIHMEPAVQQGSHGLMHGSALKLAAKSALVWRSARSRAKAKRLYVVDYQQLRMCRTTSLCFSVPAGTIRRCAPWNDRCGQGSMVSWPLFGHGGLVRVGPYADSLPLSCHFQGGGGLGQGGLGAVQRGGLPDPNI